MKRNNRKFYKNRLVYITKNGQTILSKEFINEQNNQFWNFSPEFYKNRKKREDSNRDKIE